MGRLTCCASNDTNIFIECYDLLCFPSSWLRSSPGASYIMRGPDLVHCSRIDGLAACTLLCILVWVVNCLLINCGRV